jgi:hypothetical protein
MQPHAGSTSPLLLHSLWRLICGVEASVRFDSIIARLTVNAYKLLIIEEIGY